jgi:hypothetical protein
VSILQKLHQIAGRIDPVVKFADKKNLTPSMFYPPDKPAPDIVRPVTEAGKARERAGQTIGSPPMAASRRRASQYLTKPRGLLGGG